MSAVFLRQQVAPALIKVGFAVLPAAIDLAVSQMVSRRFSSQKASWLSGAAAALGVIALITPKSLRLAAAGVFAVCKAVQTYFVYTRRPSEKICTSFFDAIDNDKIDEVKQLWAEAKQRRIPLIYDTLLGTGPLHKAVSRNKLKIAEWLLSQDTTLLNQADNEGWTPLHLAVYNCTPETGEGMVSMLLARPEILLAEQVKISGKTPLHFAVAHKKTEVARLLVARDKTLLDSKKDSDGKTPAQLALEAGLPVDFFTGPTK